MLCFLLFHVLLERRFPSSARGSHAFARWTCGQVRGRRLQLDVRLAPGVVSRVLVRSKHAVDVSVEQLGLGRPARRRQVVVDRLLRACLFAHILVCNAASYRVVYAKSDSNGWSLRTFRTEASLSVGQVYILAHLMHRNDILCTSIFNAQFIRSARLDLTLRSGLFRDALGVVFGITGFPRLLIICLLSVQHIFIFLSLLTFLL